MRRRGEGQRERIARKGARLDARLDHLFVFVDSENAALEPARAGFAVLRHGPHRGGGSANAVYRFRNAMLELAYPVDPAEVATLGAIGFAERWRWRENGQNPFGAVVQVRPADSGQFPFATWQYRPPFAPDTPWTIGEASSRETLYMLVSFQELPGSAAGPSIEGVSIRCAVAGELSAIARCLSAATVVDLHAGDASLMEISFASSALPSLDMRPHVPLVLRNVTGHGVTR
jgi:hypothetical protein